LQFEVSKQSNVLLVANGALRWKPNPEHVAPDARDEYAQSQRRSKNPGDKPAKPTGDAHNRGTLWVVDGSFVRPVKVRTGPSDGLMTEIVSGEIEEGAAVVMGESRANASGTNNPFAPKMFGGGKKPQQ
jgi:HlyD family secretion protein